MIYVALLRGINVGGQAKVEMSRLKACFETLGCHDVSTYINSGNVIFRDPRPAPTLVPLIEAAITRDFGLAICIVLRTEDNLRALCEAIPATWTNDTTQKTDVMFLWDDFDDADILTKVAINPAIENARYLPGALVWNIGRENVTRGGGIKLIKNEIYQHMTVRNINTVRKLHSLMSALG